MHPRRDQSSRTPNFLKKLLYPAGEVDKFMEIHTIIVVARKFDYRGGNVPGLTSVRYPPKTRFLPAVAKPAA
jgi:hypothetical protein